MPESPETEDEHCFQPPWETDGDADLESPFPAHARQSVEPDYHHPLLEPLARAQEALTCLETRAETASAAVAEGLLARLSYREAAGWLGYAHVWIHPHDLALRDRSLTGSYGAAFRAGRLGRQIPATTAREGEFEAAPSDIFIDQALRLARLWQRLAELRTWRPLADAAAIQETLQSLGCRGALAEPEIADWLALTEGFSGPRLIRCGRAVRDWMSRSTIEPCNPDGVFLAACLWRDKHARPIPLPFWSAPEARHYRRDLHVGLEWLADFLACVEAAALVGLDELARLQRAEATTRSLGRTARSRLPQAADAALRAPILTARDLAKSLGITTQAALGLLRQLSEAGILQEATGRSSWRAFTLAN
ncbi:MAG: hypothetical protein JO264_07870 [Acidisphaera sp.]|nr:hypothetical protein [Acidisphaera sp.]